MLIKEFNRFHKHRKGSHHLFIKPTQASFEKVAKYQDNMLKTHQEMEQKPIIMNKNTKASINNLKMKIIQLS